MLSTTSPARCSSRAKSRGSNTAPVNFDPATHPILAAHWFDAEPLHPIGPIAAKIVASPRRQRAAEHLHDLGPRPVLEALAEVEAGAGLDRVLADFERIDAETVRQLGGDRFWPAPLREIRRAS